MTTARADLTTLQGQLQSGELRALATTAATRVPVLPNILTMIESGYKNVEAEVYGGVMSPAKTPQAIVIRLIHSFGRDQDTEDPGEIHPLGFIPGGHAAPFFARSSTRITTFIAVQS